MADADVSRRTFRAALQNNGEVLNLSYPLELESGEHRGSSAAVACPSCTQASVSRTSGIIPGAIAATVFIAFVLALYAILWKCMVSPPRRKHSKVRVRIHQRNAA